MTYRSAIRFLPLMLALILCVEGRADQDETARAARVAAANASAVESLRADIFAARITPELSVSEFLDRTDSADEFDEMLRHARQIGGPRWIDDQTCQVQLELRGEEVSRTLARIAAEKQDQSPLPAAVLSKRLRQWNQKTFTASGASTSFERAQRLKPVSDREAWQAVGDDARAAAVAAAKQDAIRRLLDSIKPLQISKDLTIGDLLAEEPISQRMSGWLSTRPITRVDFRTDLLVELRLSVSPDELLDVMTDAAQGVPDLKLPNEEAWRGRLRGELARRVMAPVGRAYATPGEAPAPAAAINWPEQPPQWLQEQLDAEGIAPPARLRLQGQRSARLKAIDNLRAKVATLELTESLSIEEAGKADSRLADAVDRALDQARVFKVEYREDGSVMVRVALDPRLLWKELREAR